MAESTLTYPLDRTTLTYAHVAKTIDHSLLRTDLTEEDVIAGCAVARRYRVASVCVKPSDVPLAVRELTGCDVEVGTVVGFPHGSSTSQTKAFEARQAIELGATEVDMVINIGWLRSGADERVQRDIAAVVEAAGGKLVKVILENAYLTDEEKIRGCHLVAAAGAAFVKTSTGVAATGATLDDLRLMRREGPPRIQVKSDVRVG